MTAPVNKAPRDADLWSLHEKMLAQPLKSLRCQWGLWVFFQVLLLEVLVQASVLTRNELCLGQPCGWIQDWFIGSGCKVAASPLRCSWKSEFL